MELNLSQLKAAVVDKPEVVTEEELVGRELAFEVQYFDPDTREFLVGQFVSRIPDNTAKQEAGRIMARLAGDYQFDVMPQHWKVWAAAVAFCSTQLPIKPDWFDVKALKDDDLLFAVQGRLEDHADRYFRPAPAKSEEEAERPRVVIRAASPGAAARTGK